MRRNDERFTAGIIIVRVIVGIAVVLSSAMVVVIIVMVMFSFTGMVIALDYKEKLRRTE